MSPANFDAQFPAWLGIATAEQGTIPKDRADCF